MLSFDAPVDATLTHVKYARLLASTEASWLVSLVAQDGQAEWALESCRRVTGQFGCPDLTGTGTYSGDLLSGITRLELQLSCDDFRYGLPCTYGQGPGYAAAAIIYSSEVTVEENVAPVATAPVVTGLTPSGWFTDASRLTIGGSDTLGIRRLELVSGGSVIDGEDGSCVDWSVLPCSEPSAGLSTGKVVEGDRSDFHLTDGIHTLRTASIDAAANRTESSPVTVKVDVTTPVATATAGGGLAAAPSRALTWTVPAGGSPIVGSRAQLCWRGGGCSWQDIPAAGPLPITISDPAGEVAVALELTDGAGHVGTSAATTFTRDAVAPATPRLTLRAESGRARTVGIETSDTDVDSYVVLRCIAGGACTPIQYQGVIGKVDLELPAVGEYDLKVALRDRLGNVSDYGSLRLSLPGTAPGPGVPPVAQKRASGLKSSRPKWVKSREVSVRGTAVAGSTANVTVTLRGRDRKNRVVTKTRVLIVRPSGKFTGRVTLPKSARRARGVRVTITGTPNPGYLGAVVRHALLKP